MKFDKEAMYATTVIWKRSSEAKIFHGSI